MLEYTSHRPRQINWQDLDFLARLVRRGVGRDEEWKRTWQQYCEEWRIPSDVTCTPPKAPLTLFVERNVWQLVSKDCSAADLPQLPKTIDNPK